MNDKRGNWYLLTGLVLGMVLGIAYTRFIQPVVYIDMDPASLDEEFQIQYRGLIASAFLTNKDLVRAQARLDLLGDPNISETLSEDAQHLLAESESIDEARALGVLASALQPTTLTPTNTPPANVTPDPK